MSIHHSEYPAEPQQAKMLDIPFRGFSWDHRKSGVPTRRSLPRRPPGKINTTDPSSMVMPARKRAIIAIAHSLLKIAYAILTTGQPYREPGAGFYDRRDSAQARQDYLLRQLRRATVATYPAPVRCAGIQRVSAGGSALVRALRSAVTPLASAAPILRKISCAWRRLACARAVRSAAKAQRPRPASAQASSLKLPIWRARCRACR